MICDLIDRKVWVETGRKKKMNRIVTYRASCDWVTGTELGLEEARKTDRAQTTQDLIKHAKDFGPHHKATESH